MLRHSFDRSTDAEQFMPIPAFACDKIRNHWRTERQGTCLIKSDNRRACHILDMGAAFEQYAFSGAIRNCRQHRRHDGGYQRTRGGYYEKHHRFIEGSIPIPSKDESSQNDQATVAMTTTRAYIDSNRLINRRDSGTSFSASSTSLIILANNVDSADWVTSMYNTPSRLRCL